MQDNHDVKKEGDVPKGRNISNERRKRVNRIKTAMILTFIVLLLLSLISCIILGIQVSRLQKQVDHLTVIQKQYETADSNRIATAENESKHTSKQKGKNYVYAAVKSETAVKEKQNTKAKEGIYSGKKVYLTFDDGPSIYTGKILDILSKYHCKATFFVIGKTDPKSKELYQRIVKEGHTLAMHSYSHDYGKIYKSVEDFDKDFTKLWKLLYDTTGYKPSIYRFPGGSINLKNTNGVEDYVRYLNKKSIVYYDWNVVSGDATNITYTKDQLVSNVLNGVAAKDRSIVLMHDSQTKKSTAASLSKLIKALKSGGAQILPLDKNVSPIQMIKSDSIK